MKYDKIKKQMAFILEIDRLKTIFRRNKITDGSRYENDAEHSWHFAMMAVILQEHANLPGIDILKVVKMGLIHDIVEIDAGDTFIYREDLMEDKLRKERAAAERIFGLLPAGQKEEMIALWQEFEEKRTPEAKFAGALDRLGPVLLNYHNRALGWRENNVPPQKVLDLNSRIAEGSEKIWEYAKGLIEDAMRKGYFQNDQD